VTTIHLYEFINIDLQRKGTYSIQLKLYSHHPDFNTKTFYLPTFKDNSPTTVGWKNSATDLAGGNTSSKFVSDDFNIEFVDQTTSIDKVLRFSTVVQVKNFEEGEVDVLGLLELSANISLLFNGVKEQTRKLKFNKNQEISTTKPQYAGIRFDGINFAHLDLTGNHSTLPSSTFIRIDHRQSNSRAYRSNSRRHASINARLQDRQYKPNVSSVYRFYYRTIIWSWSDDPPC
jgi:hypothetical protein